MRNVHTFIDSTPIWTFEKTSAKASKTGAHKQRVEVPTIIWQHPITILNPRNMGVPTHTIRKETTAKVPPQTGAIRQQSRVVRNLYRQPRPQEKQG